MTQSVLLSAATAADSCADRASNIACENLADVGLRRAEPGVFGAVASDPTVSRLIAGLAADAPKALLAMASARGTARAWAAAGDGSPDQGIDAEHRLIIDLDATLVTAHSEKENAAPNFKRGFGFSAP